MALNTWAKSCESVLLICDVFFRYLRLSCLICSLSFFIFTDEDFDFFCLFFNVFVFVLEGVCVFNGEMSTVLDRILPNCFLTIFVDISVI